MKTNTRFIKSVTEAAAQSDAAMPWACSKRPEACITESTEVTPGTRTAS